MIESVEVDQELGQKMEEQYQEQMDWGNNKNNQNRNSQKHTKGDPYNSNKNSHKNDNLFTLSFGGSLSIGSVFNGAIGFTVGPDGKGYYFVKWEISLGVSVSAGVDATMTKQSIMGSLGSGSNISMYGNSNDITGNFLLPVGPIIVLSSKDTGLKPIGVGVSGGVGLPYSAVSNSTLQTFSTPVFNIGSWLTSFGICDLPVLMP